MLHPDEINDILNRDDKYEITSGTEQAEGELRGALNKVFDGAAPDTLIEIGIALMAPHEERLRRENPNHPGLKFLDQYRPKA